MDITEWMMQDEIETLLHLEDEMTGEIEMDEHFQLQPGETIWWEDQLFLTGYAPAPVRAIFIKTRKAKVKDTGIAVQMRSGEWWPKWVAARNVKIRNVIG